MIESGDEKLQPTSVCHLLTVWLLYLLAAGDALAKEVKKLAVSAPADDEVLETDAQKAARVADVEKTLAEINAEDPR